MLKAGRDWRRVPLPWCLPAKQALTSCKICRTSFFSLNDTGRPLYGVATFCKDATAAPVAAEDGLAGTRLQAAASAGRGICLEPESTWWWRCAHGGGKGSGHAFSLQVQCTLKGSQQLLRCWEALIGMDGRPRVRISRGWLAHDPRNLGACRIGLIANSSFGACRYSQAELEALDNEGRCIITDHRAFVLFNLYLPACLDQTKMENKIYRRKLRMLEAWPQPLHIPQMQ